MNNKSIILKESELKAIIGKAIKSKLNESENPKFYIYHCAHAKDVASIFKYGAERAFFNTNAGNAYGKGVYTTRDLQSSIVNAKRGTYGRVIIKFKVWNNYEKFIIWDEKLAKAVYGDSWRVVDQFKLLFPYKVIEGMKRISGYNGSFYDFLIGRNHFTSTQARIFYEKYEKYKEYSHAGINPYNLVDGFAFKGQLDGEVAVFKDAKSVSPYQYSEDLGRTWKTGETKTTLEYTKNSFDSEYLYGHLYDKVFVTERGWAKVMKDGKVNYINKDGSELSNTWLDGGGHFYAVGNSSMAEVVYEGESFFVTPEGHVYETIDDQYPICELDELPDLFN